MHEEGAYQRENDHPSCNDSQKSDSEELQKSDLHLQISFTFGDERTMENINDRLNDSPNTRWCKFIVVMSSIFSLFVLGWSFYYFLAATMLAVFGRKKGLVQRFHLRCCDCLVLLDIRYVEPLSSLRMDVLMDC